jgi:flagellar hook-basal body complex protein FliE
MSPGYIPPISTPPISTKISSPFETGLNGVASRFQLEAPSDTKGPSFKNVMGTMMQNLNNTLSEPDQLMNQAMTTGDVDVHDVMIANAKAELLVNVSTQIATKVMQAYDRILQIQI